MKPLTFEELKEVIKNNKRVKFHPDYHYEGWKDGEGSLTLTDVSVMGNFRFVGYRCSNPKCFSCNSNDISRSICGHHQLLNEDGTDIYGKVEFTETKKNTIVKHLDNPVFILEE